MALSDEPTGIRRVSEAAVPTRHGLFVAVAYQSLVDGVEHVAFTRTATHAKSSGSEPDDEAQVSFSGLDDVMVRVHSECLTGDIFGSLRCDCGPQLDQAMERIDAEAEGVLVYLRGHEGRGIGLGHKIRAYGLQDRQGLDTVDANLHQGLPADSRDYTVGAQILLDLGLTTVRLLTNNPKKYVGLEAHGLRITERMSLETSPTPENIEYLRTKRERLGHLLNLGEAG